MNQITRFVRSLTHVSKQGFHFPQETSTVHSKPGITAKRLINCVSQRLNKIDPGRWNGVPISFKTHWCDEGGAADIETCIHVHDAVEREFGIEVKDRCVLLTDMETAFSIVMMHHDSI